MDIICASHSQRNRILGTGYSHDAEAYATLCDKFMQKPRKPSNLSRTNIIWQTIRNGVRMEIHKKQMECGRFFCVSVLLCWRCGEIHKAADVTTRGLWRHRRGYMYILAFIFFGICFISFFIIGLYAYMFYLCIIAVYLLPYCLRWCIRPYLHHPTGSKWLPSPRNQ